MGSISHFFPTSWPGLHSWQAGTQLGLPPPHWAQRPVPISALPVLPTAARRTHLRALEENSSFGKKIDMASRSLLCPCPSVG